ncbi:Purple acid phosphatase 23 [Diplonema papillatum]|nr:Purple acid phosphatase [Diplonema papillatum]KAJ9459722.1 Purple acid phosphatase 23 [Diplonema papillatum]
MFTLLAAVASLSLRAVDESSGVVQLQPAGFVASWGNATDVLVTWEVVGGDCERAAAPRCDYWVPGSAKFTSPAFATTYTDKCTGQNQCTAWVGCLFTAALNSTLVDETMAEGQFTFNYVCGDGTYGFSDTKSVVSRREPAAGEEFSFFMTADNGFDQNATSVKDGMLRYQEDLASPMARFFLVVGDIAYSNGNQTLWDVWMQGWESLQSAVPTLFSPGNHDGRWLFGNNYEVPNAPKVGGGESGTSYSKRLPGPGPNVFVESNLGQNIPNMNSTSYWWSVAYGGIRIIALSTVHDFSQSSAQYAWFVNELKQADTPESRKVNPWVIVTSHFPMYCTIDDCFCGNYTQAALEQRCQSGGTVLPGILEVNGVFIKAQLEELLLEYHVDLFLAGHEHAYERTLPINNLVPTVARPPTRKPAGTTDRYINPTAPIHIMAGSGGGSPDSDWRDYSAFNWTVVRSDDFENLSDRPYGFLVFTMSGDRTKLSGAYVNVVKNHTYDRFEIVKSGF